MSVDCLKLLALWNYQASSTEIPKVPKYECLIDTKERDTIYLDTAKDICCATENPHARSVLKVHNLKEFKRVPTGLHLIQDVNILMDEAFIGKEELTRLQCSAPRF